MFRDTHESQGFLVFMGFMRKTFKKNKMRNKTDNPVQQNNEELVVAFQDFNGVYLAKISNKKDKETHAFGETKDLAEKNALKNYNLKYNTPYYLM